LKFRNKCLRLW